MKRLTHSLLKLQLLTLLASLSFAGQAKIFARFHPYQSTLEEMAEYIKSAKSKIDIAVYNIDSNTKNPVIAAIASEEVQLKLRSGELSIRLIFEGYESPEKVNKKMTQLESFGVDVRHLRSGRKMHHKFLVIDHDTTASRLVTGSANFSLMSQNKFSESILFFEDEKGITDNFQEQFNVLWDISKEVGLALEHESRQTLGLEPEAGFETYFNTENFDLSTGKIRKSRTAEGYHLTRQIVDLIDSAESHIEIATTRIKLRPIYNALERAAARGVKIQIIVTMGQYEYQSRRKRFQLESCEDEFYKKCSTSKNFAVLLSRENFTGSENVDVRLKYFHIRKAAYLGQQMHSKYIIVDGNSLLTGSFNWSFSAEYNHIENLVYVDGNLHPEVLHDFQNDFAHLWHMNRENYNPMVSKVEDAVRNGTKIKCGFKPMALSYPEIDHLVDTGRRLGSSLKGVCK